MNEFVDLAFKLVFVFGGFGLVWFIIQKIHAYDALKKSNRIMSFALRFSYEDLLKMHSKAMKDWESGIKQVENMRLMCDLKDALELKAATKK